MLHKTDCTYKLMLNAPANLALLERTRKESKKESRRERMQSNPKYNQPELWFSNSATPPTPEQAPPPPPESAPSVLHQGQQWLAGMFNNNSTTMNTTNESPIVTTNPSALEQGTGASAVAAAVDAAPPEQAPLSPESTPSVLHQGRQWLVGMFNNNSTTTNTTKPNESPKVTTDPSALEQGTGSAAAAVDARAAEDDGGGCDDDDKLRFIGWYAFVIIFLLVVIVFPDLFGTCDDTDDEGHDECATHRGLFRLSGILVYGIFIAYSVKYNESNWYLRNIRSIDSTIEYIEKLRSSVPILKYKVLCSHWVSGNENSSGHEKVTFSETKCVDGQLFRVTDSTLPIRHISHPITMLKISKRVIRDDSYERYLREMTDQHLFKDDKMVVLDKMEFKKGFNSCHILVLSDDGSVTATNRFFLNIYCSVLAHVLVVPALPYRLWLCYIAKKFEVDLHKRISMNYDTNYIPLTQEQIAMERALRIGRMGRHNWFPFM